MAQSTTSVSGCNVVVSLDNAAGTLTDISGSSNQVEMSFTNVAGTYRNAASSNPTRYLIEQDLTISLTILYSTATDEALDILRKWVAAGITGSDARSLRVDIPDSTAGSDRYEVEVLATQFDIPASAADAGPILASVALESTGAYTVSEIT